MRSGQKVTSGRESETGYHILHSEYINHSARWKIPCSHSGIKRCRNNPAAIRTESLHYFVNKPNLYPLSSPYLQNQLSGFGDPKILWRYFVSPYQQLGYQDHRMQLPTGCFLDGIQFLQLAIPSRLYGAQHPSWNPKSVTQLVRWLNIKYKPSYKTNLDIAIHRSTDKISVSNISC